MTFSGMGTAERNAAISAAVVVITALVLLGSAWGVFPIFGLLAGAGAVFVPYQPRVAPTMALPGSKGSLLTALGVVAVVASVLAGLQWSSYVTGYIANVDTVAFFVGLIASVVLAWSGWQILKAEGGKFRFGGPASMPPAAMPPAAMPPGETPPGQTPPGETPPPPGETPPPPSTTT